MSTETKASVTGSRRTEAKAPVAVVASRYPKLSETFVYREVGGLRDLGRTIRTLTLRAPKGDPALLDGIAPADVEVYGPQLPGRFLREFVRHPIRTSGTLLLAVRDALAPGEATGYRTRRALLAQAVAGISVADELRSHGIRHVHCHFAHAPAGVGMYAARQAGTTFSFTGHANDLFRNRALLVRKLERAAFVSCISQWHHDWYASQVPAVLPRLQMIRCGVESRAGAESAGPAPPPLRVLTVARLVPKKGIDVLIRALAGSGLDWQLDVAGDGPERETLENLIDELSLASRVRMHGAVANDRVDELMRGVHLFALPCRVDAEGDRDGIPVVLMEAMATGLPVVAGDLPTLRDLIQPEETGLLTPPDQIEPLREAIRRVASDPALRQRLADAGRHRVEQEFSLTVNALRLDAQLP